ncbi:MarR family transcriptional regulator [Micromonospora sp. NPDC049044]|uniref:MarR family winged helix-turn-helix transcriptional regulator n=1 Tax=unclassified Micromonospora TaxID=2617518 RepID=UPI0033F2BDAC
MAELHSSTDPETSMAAALDETAAALLGIWESAREGTAGRVSGAQLRAVMVVEQHDGINLRRLATRLDMLLSSASRLCDRLVAAGMLEREPGRFDRREISLHLTPEARRLLTELRADRQARLAVVLAGMSPAGRHALLDGMREFDEVARQQRAQRTPKSRDWPDDPDRPGGRSDDWSDDPDRPGGRSDDWSIDPDRQTRQAWADQSGAPELSIGGNRDRPADGPPVARTA